MPPDFYSSEIRNVIMPLIPFLTGLFRFRKMDAAYHSLIYVFGAAVVAEIIRFILLYFYYTRNQEDIFRSFSGYNCYVLAIGLLFTHLFYKWGIFGNKKWLFITIQLSLAVVWIGDHFVFSGFRIHAQTIIYRLFYSFLLCLYSIQQINRLLVTEKGILIRNSSFLVCFCILFFFIPYIISEGILLFDPKVSFTFRESVFSFRSIANPIDYFIYTIAVLWIPPKKNFIQLS